MQNLQDLLKKVDDLLDSVDVEKPSQNFQPPTDPLLTALETHFGYTSFRKGQREIVASILDGKNVFAVFQLDTENRCVTNFLP